MEQPIFARQPIYDRNLNCIAYEFLFRDTILVDINSENGDQATSHLLLDVTLSSDFSSHVGNNLAFINFTRNLLLNPPLPLTSLHPKQIVIEILENIEIDNEIYTAIKHLKNLGYAIALDDFIYHEKYNSLIEIADYIKIDILNCDELQIKNQVNTLKNFSGVLLAEKVETYEQFEWCKTLGFTAFQGFFMCKPQIITGKRINTHQKSALNIFSALQNSNIEYEELEFLINQDAELCYKILRLGNSSIYRSMKPIHSIKDVIFRMGINDLRHWISLILLSSMNTEVKELKELSLIRAKMCELLGNQMKLNIMSSHLFTLGLLSLLDSILGETFEELFKELNLNEPLKLALLSRSGPMGFLLQQIELYERHEWFKINLENRKLLGQAFVQSLNWLLSIKANL